MDTKIAVVLFSLMAGLCLLLAKINSLITAVYHSLIAFCQKVDSQCGPIGTNNETAFTAVRRLRFYLNTAYPAPCSGTVTRWRHCYYRPDTTGNRYWVTWAVYRRMGSGNATNYVMVDSSLRTVSRRNNQIPNSGGFWCRNQNIANDFNIEAGDVVAACIYDPVDSNGLVRKQLDIIGQVRGYSLMQMSDVSSCGSSSMPSVISSSQLSTVDSNLLHLYATITSMFCVLA